jgi:hypothetical protein
VRDCPKADRMTAPPPTTATILIAVPVLARPGNAARVAQSAAEATTGCPYRLLYLCSPGDTAEIDACLAVTAASNCSSVTVAVVPFENGPGDWARKLNHAIFDLSDEPYILLGADDLRFHHGWDTAVLELLEAGYGLVGTNDLGNPSVTAGVHATHPVASRLYAEACGTIDECGQLLHEGYDHQHVDVEAVETAKARGAWAFAAGSRVEHLHPFWRKGRDDATYRQGRANSGRDLLLYRSRQHLWSGLAAA